MGRCIWLCWSGMALHHWLMYLAGATAFYIDTSRGDSKQSGYHSLHFSSETVLGPTNSRYLAMGRDLGRLMSVHALSIIR